MPGTEITIIPQIRRVFKDTYANLPTTGLRTGDLGYATDRKVFYRWSGSAWEAVTVYSGSGTAANIPNAADLPAGSLYFETDTEKTKQVQSSAWVDINPLLFYSGFGTAANIPSAAGLPDGSLYYETDTGITKQIQSSAWVTISDPPSSQGRISIYPFAYSAIGQGTWAMLYEACYLYGRWSNQGAMADGDNVSYNVYLDKGTYKIWMMASKGTAFGILDIYIDAAEVASFDLYAGGTQTNVIVSQAGINVASRGRKTLKVQVDGKHASSSNYLAIYQLIILERTA